MQDVMLPLIRKVELLQIQVNIARAGLAIGDTAELRWVEPEQVIVVARLRRRFLGLFPHRRMRPLGVLGPAATAMLLPSLQNGKHLRVRIVGLTPEHLSYDGDPEVFISVWGDPVHLLETQADLPQMAKPDPVLSPG